MKTMLGRSDRALIFEAVATESSFTRAAEKLGCSRAHVSAQLAELEADLGVQLVHRTTRKVSLTEAGTLYLEYARQVHDSLVEAERAVSATRSDVAGRLRVTAPTSLGETVMPDLFLAFQERYPNIESVIDLSPVRRDLTADKTDVAFRPTRTLDNNLIARPIGVVRERVVAAPALLEQYRPIERPEDLQDLPCLLNSHFGDDPHWLFLRGDDSISVTVKGPLTVNSYQALRRFAVLGAGAALLPHYIVNADLSAGRLRSLCDGWQTSALPLYIVYPVQRHLPLRTRVFVDFAIAWFKAPARRVMFG